VRQGAGVQGYKGTGVQGWRAVLTARLGCPLMLLVLGLKSHAPVGTRWAESPNVIGDVLSKVILRLPQVGVEVQEELLGLLNVCIHLADGGLSELRLHQTHKVLDMGCPGCPLRRGQCFLAQRWAKEGEALGNKGQHLP